MLCYVMLCYVMLCYVMLCYVNCTATSQQSVVEGNVFSVHNNLENVTAHKFCNVAVQQS